jgi:hypothetical protein
MSKRIVASIVGVLAVLASLIAFAKAFFGLEDFRNPAVPLRVVGAGELIMCSIALAALGMGIRFLRFAWSGRTDPSSTWVKPVLLGIGFFFPGFMFSLPLTVLWARHTWPGDGQSYLAAMDASVCVGIAAAIICLVVLLKKRVSSVSKA